MQGVGFTRLTRTSEGVMPLNLSGAQGTGAVSALRPLGGPLVVDSQGQRVPSDAGGGSVISRGGAYVCTRSYAEKQLVLLFGSHVAAAMLLPWGRSNNLATQQLLEACKVSARPGPGLSFPRRLPGSHLLELCPSHPSCS